MHSAQLILVQVLLLLSILLSASASDTKSRMKEFRSRENLCGAHERLQAFVFFGKWPSEDVLDFAGELSERTAFGVYVVPDDEDFHWAEAHRNPKVQVRLIPKSDVIKANFTHSSNYKFAAEAPPEKAIWAKERALTLAASEEFSEQYCRVWLIEDDVFIPSVEAAIHVTRLAKGNFDYISTSDVQPYPWPYWSNWRRFKEMLKRFPLPSEDWRHNMANAVGLSTTFIAILSSFARANGQLVFDEAMYPTLALALNRTHLKLDELYLFPTSFLRGSNFNWEEIAEHKLWWYHPMKDTQARQAFRQRIREESQIKL